MSDDPPIEVSQSGALEENVFIFGFESNTPVLVNLHAELSPGIFDFFFQQGS